MKVGALSAEQRGGRHELLKGGVPKTTKEAIER